MEFSTFLAVGIIMKFVMVISMACSVLLILLVLIQKGKGGGLSSAFGGSGAGGLLGAKTGDVLTWVTVGLATLFLLLMIIMAKYYKPTVNDTTTPQIQTTPAQQSKQNLPVTTRVNVPEKKAPATTPQQTPVESVPATIPEQTPAPEDAGGNPK